LKNKAQKIKSRERALVSNVKIEKLLLFNAFKSSFGIIFNNKVYVYRNEKSRSAEC
jgi:hypothetical protein